MTAKCKLFMKINMLVPLNKEVDWCFLVRWLAHGE